MIYYCSNLLIQLSYIINQRLLSISKYAINNKIEEFYFLRQMAQISSASEHVLLLVTTSVEVLTTTY